MALVGYARVSSYGQNLESQTKKLQEYGCKKIYKEKISGVDQNGTVAKNYSELQKGYFLVLSA
ncbi:hypothetical protein Psal006b_03246 (plasmid) [Piscirickettsia salmonis]|uniref:Resolvase n=1 Tax=Piscirickettsia salmonis TaxID=1238 RepID=A0A1L6TI89_PISSA|nr:recombinase family protein [Piscirickettsia salmonis]AKP74956.1 hypothetical protein PSLF89_1p173 [Piscirickettsia salmonis LF-89 = ATCC VR-1361]ALB24615.1 resolvase [Piscirickettsia salmonis]ALY04491.1 hypothetical protein AWE47_16390 [Piscirickettsia salmonis]AMA43937.1 hypothetical protein AWJ11_16255 [Piscirickettsia salmonis]AOS37166.1 hypothetical protein AVM72_17635 [Piscirickettsia salmonis]